MIDGPDLSGPRRLGNAGRQQEEQSMSKVLGYRRPYFDTQPALLYPSYRSTIKRAPSKPLVHLPHTIPEVTGPLFGPADLGPNDHDLTAQHEGAPIGERIGVSGRVLDENSKSVANVLIQLWQAHSAGRY